MCKRILARNIQQVVKQPKISSGSETEVTCDFVFRREASLWEPPASNNRPPMFGFAGRWRPLLYCVFAFYESNLTYIKVLFCLQIFSNICNPFQIKKNTMTIKIAKLK